MNNEPNFKYSFQAPIKWTPWPTAVETETAYEEDDTLLFLTDY